MKALIKKTMESLGYEIHRRDFPAWPPPDGPAPSDEVIPGPWLYHVLQMANRHYRPDTLRYHRTVFGQDERLKYMIYFLDLRDQRVLEIGPLEGHHSVILEKMGVRENISVESRPENLRKCLRIKDKYHLDRTTFLLNDLERLYNKTDTPRFNGPFDLVFCLGVLYHLPEPGKALQWFRSQSNRLFLGTHFAQRHETGNMLYMHDGKTYRARKHSEGGIADPISGMSSASLWLYEDDLLRLIRDTGYSRVSVLGKDLQNSAPHITILAE